MLNTRTANSYTKPCIVPERTLIACCDDKLIASFLVRSNMGPKSISMYSQWRNWLCLARFIFLQKNRICRLCTQYFSVVVARYICLCLNPAVLKTNLSHPFPMALCWDWNGFCSQPVWILTGGDFGHNYINVIKINFESITTPKPSVS